MLGNELKGPFPVGRAKDLVARPFETDRDQLENVRIVLGNDDDHPRRFIRVHARGLVHGITR